MKSFFSLIAICLCLSVISCDNRDNPNDPGSANYVKQPAPSPTFSKPPETYNEPISITIVPPENKFDIYYTLDGSPATPETGRLYNGEPILINTTTKISAISYNDKWDPSKPVDAVYTIEPLPERISVSPSSPVTLAKGDIQYMRATLFFNNGTQKDITSEASWSADNAVLTLYNDPGSILAVEQGEAVVEVSYSHLISSVIVKVIPR